MKTTTVRQLAKELIILCDNFKAKKITDKVFVLELSSLALIHGDQLYSFEGLSPTIKVVIGKKRAWTVEHFLSINAGDSSPAEKYAINYENIADDIISNKGLLYKNAQDRLYMDKAIKHLMCWDEMIVIYKGKKLETYKFIVACFIDMACMSHEEIYKGSRVSSNIFIDKINEYILFPDCIFEDIILGQLTQALEDALNNYTVTDIRKYTKSYIWDYLVTCRLKLELEISKNI